MRKYRIAFLSADWNYEIVSDFFTGIKKFMDEHNDTSVVAYDSFGAYGVDEMYPGALEIFDLMNYEKIDGIVIQGNQAFTGENRQRIVNEAAKHNIPVASINYPLNGAIYVGTDNLLAMKAVVYHVIEEHQPKTFAFVKGLERSSEAAIRLNAFIGSMNENFITEDRYRLYDATWSREDGIKAAQKMIEEGHVAEAVICANDDLAVGVASVLKENGYRIPEDVIVTGFDDLDIAASFEPRITTVGRDYELVAYTAIETIYAMLHGEKIERDVYAPYKLVLGESCGCQGHLKLERIKDKYFNTNAYMRNFYIMQSHMNQPMMNAESLSEIMDIFEKSASYFECKDIYVCINMNYLQHFDEEVNEEELSHYMALMGIAGEKRANEKATELHVYEVFDSKELLPERFIEEDELMIAYPLYHNEKNMGYIVTVGVSPAVQFNYLETTLTFMEMAITNLRQKLIMNKLNKRLGRLYIKDSLTDLYNRFGLHTQGKESYSKLMSKDHECFIYFIDIDKMKDINDLYGHAMGDSAIKEVSNIIRKVATREDDFCMRYGGDEFVVITDMRFTCFKEMMLTRKEKLNKAGKYPFELEFSIGKYVAKENEELEQAIENADASMYKVKNKR